MFDVDIWGTVSSWVGAVLTGGGVLVAGLVYRRDSNLSRYSQARKVLVQRYEDDDVCPADLRRWDSTLRVEVGNFSDQPIFNVIAAIDMKPQRVEGPTRLRQQGRDSLEAEAAGCY